jgi:hypothetical protein
MHKKIPDFKESVSQLDERDRGCRIVNDRRGVVARCRSTPCSRKAPPLTNILLCTIFGIALH